MIQANRLYQSRLFFLVLLCAFFFSSPAISQSPVFPSAQKGVLDLRQNNLEQQTIPLSGEWAIYWKELLTPKKDSVTSPTAFVPFPVLWNKTIINGQALTSIGYSSYSLTVYLPRRSIRLALQVPDTYASYRLFVNGEEFAKAGNPDSTKESSIPKWIPYTLELDTKSDTLRLILQVANFWHTKGGPYKNILIGDRDSLFNDKETDSALDLVLTGCLFMGGLFFIGLFLFGKHDKSILYFALFCMAYSYRIVGSRGYVLHAVFPDIPWTITAHFEYLTLFIAVAFFSLYTYHLYPEDSSKNATKIQVWSCLGLCAIVVLFPPAIFTQLINPFLVLMFVVLVYTFYVYIKAVRKKRLGATYALLSTAVVLIVGVVINLQYFNLLQPQKGILFVGYISFFFLQSLILSFRFARALKQAKDEAELGLKAKNEFLSTMSHEIRTPLNSILGMTHLILRDNPRTEQKEQLNVLLFSANNLLAIVNDILDYNKIEAGKINFESIEMDLANIVKNILSGLRTMAEEKRIDLRLQIDPALHNKIMGDPTRVGQVITNLVSNAIKFTRKGFVLLDIKVKNQTNEDITLTIRVEDTGIGIAQEKQKIIFERFTQADTSTSRNFGGTGLGLAICKRLLELQGSSLQLISEHGKGSVFYFTQTFPKLAVTEKKMEIKTDRLPTEESKPLTGISILLVEDNEINILVARTFLERWGASIDVAHNGLEALNKIDPEKHKLVLMDMHMPVMDGYEATHRIREKGITIPIVALTASLPREVDSRLKDSGITDIIVKPFVPEELFKTILHYTNVYRSTEEKE
jgi:signal transduction histidine kinase/ActR/RegA family two-component response regulator